MKIAFTVPGEPQGKSRPRFDSIRHRTYTPTKTKQYEELIAYCYRFAGGNLFDGPVTVTVLACYAVPTSISKRKQALLLAQEEPVKRKPDIDNVTKAVLDALNHIAYNDDKQVISLVAAKCYAEKPCLMIEIEGVSQVQGSLTSLLSHFHINKEKESDEIGNEKSNS